MPNSRHATRDNTTHDLIAIRDAHPQDDAPTDLGELLHLRTRLAAAEARLAALEARDLDIVSIAASAYDLGRRSADPPDSRTADASAPEALRLACLGSGPPVDVAVVDPAGIRHTLRVTPGVNDPDETWARFVWRSQSRDSA